MGKLYALGDIHLSYKFNIDALQQLTPHPDDGLILAGDVGETAEQLHLAFRTCCPLFKKVFWVPGNHDLYSMPVDAPGVEQPPRGVAKYEECLEVCSLFGVVTPEDEYLEWECEGGETCLICPVFTLYDYSFRPDHVSREEVLEWSMEENIRATDEAVLFSEPFASRDAWCHERVRKTEERLEKAKERGRRLVIINHWPLRQGLVYIPLIPRFSPWCGTKLTEEWHKRFNAKVVVTGHLHVRRTDWIDGVRFEECSLGYPKQWEKARQRGHDVNSIMREILPGPEQPEHPQTQWRQYG